MGDMFNYVCLTVWCGILGLGGKQTPALLGLVGGWGRWAIPMVKSMNSTHERHSGATL